MKIPTTYDPSNLSAQRAASHPRAAESQAGQAQPAATGAQWAQSASVAVSVSPLAQSLQTGSSSQVAVVDTAKVKSVKAAIANGTYSVNPEAIADKMLSGAQELLGRSR